MNAQSHQCNNIPLQLKLNLVQKDAPLKYLLMYFYIRANMKNMIFQYNISVE